MIVSDILTAVWFSITRSFITKAHETPPPVKAGSERRQEHRVELTEAAEAARCTLVDEATQKRCDARLVNISPGGVKLAVRTFIPTCRILKVTFFDAITGEEISFFTVVLSGSKRRRGLFELSCKNDPRVELPPAYRRLYDRLLSDSHLSHITKATPRKAPVDIRAALFGKKISFKIADTAAEREAAYRLVYEEYLHRGFADPNPHKLFTYIYQLFPGTTTVVGIVDGEVVMTISSISDSPFRLPMDNAFSDVIEPLRQGGRRLAEFGMLAVKKQLFDKGAYCLQHFYKMSATFSMFRFVTQHAMQVRKATDVVIAIPPRYQDLYSYLCFSRLSDIRHYGKYNTPALAMRLNLEQVSDPHYMQDIGRPLIVNYFFKKKVDPRKFADGAMSKEDMRYLFSKKSDLIERLPAEDVRAVTRHYPEIGWWIAEFLMEERRRRARDGEIRIDLPTARDAEREAAKEQRIRPQNAPNPKKGA